MLCSVVVFFFLFTATFKVHFISVEIKKIPEAETQIPCGALPQSSHMSDNKATDDPIPLFPKHVLDR